LKKTELMKRLSGPDAGFTLIELMIVVAIIGILIAIAIPNFLRAMDKARFTRCTQSLTGLKVAEEMYISDHNVYTSGAAGDPGSEALGMYMVPGCTLEAGCGTAVEDRIGSGATPKNCAAWTITALSGGFDYKITGTATDRYKCHICVTPKGVFPETYTAANCGAACPL
jgi:prepilin-type N-terminal cleavage/methylation domain-containing protein